VHEIVAEAEGDVQDETEQEMLDQLLERLQLLVEGLDEGAILIVENEQGHDYPKTRQEISNVVVQGENRLRFRYTLAPPLRVAEHRPRRQPPVPRAPSALALERAWAGPFGPPPRSGPGRIGPFSAQWTGPHRTVLRKMARAIGPPPRRSIAWRERPARAS